MTALEHCSLVVKISDVPISNDETSIFVKCHDRSFSKVTITDDKDEELFVGTSPGPSKSCSWRRHVKDSSGLPIFDLRHHGWAMKNMWTAEGPHRHQNAELKTLKDRSPGRRSNFDMVISNPKEDEDIVLQVRQKDYSAITTQVFFMDACIAKMLLQESNDGPDANQVDRSVWNVRVARGVVPAVILIIALCRAGRHHMLWQ